MNERATPGVVDNAATVESDKQNVKQKEFKLSKITDKCLNLLSSIPFGITMLILLITACMIGMLIQQIQLETFPQYYAELTPAEQIVYGSLGFFDIYHAWYFNLLLALLSLCIILTSIDHFPAAWSFIKRKKLTASPTFVMSQKFKEKIELPGFKTKQLTERAAQAARAAKYKIRVTEESSRTTIFAERGAWNRLGAYAVHIGLLTIFAGGFLTSRGYVGSMQLTLNQKSDRMLMPTFEMNNSGSFMPGVRELELPFYVTATDLRQRLLNNQGSLAVGNTLDWMTHISVNDKETGKKTEAIVHMNNPFDYRGYRFFMQSVNGIPNARSVKIQITPATGGASQVIDVMRKDEAKLPDGTRLKYLDFNPSFTINKEGSVGIGSTDYDNPAAHIAYVLPDGTQGDTWVFNEGFLQQIPNAPFLKANLSKYFSGPYQFALKGFEKVNQNHVLSVQYDPGARVVYVGFTILCLTLIGVFFFSHQRLWITVEDGNVYVGGDSNRNKLGFEDRARKITEKIQHGA